MMKKRIRKEAITGRLQSEENTFMRSTKFSYLHDEKCIYMWELAVFGFSRASKTDSQLLCE